MHRELLFSILRLTKLISIEKNFNTIKYLINKRICGNNNSGILSGTVSIYKGKRGVLPHQIIRFDECNHVVSLFCQEILKKKILIGYGAPTESNANLAVSTKKSVSVTERIKYRNSTLKSVGG